MTAAQKLQRVLGLSSADELDAQQAAKATKADAPAARAGAQAPVSLGESVIHAAADAALDRLNGVLGVRPETRDGYLTGPDGAALRNCLRRYVMHAIAASTESDK